MSNFNAGSTRGHSQAKTEEWVQSAKNTANAATDKAAEATQCDSNSAQQKKEEAGNFLQQTGEQMAHMAQGAVDGIKNTLGVGDHSHKK